MTLHIHLNFSLIFLITKFVIKMDAYHLNIDIIKENRNFKDISQEDANELINSLYGFSLLSYEAYNKKDIQHGEY